MAETDLEELLAAHRSIRESLPNAWNSFFARFGSLRPVQLAAIPRIVAGENVLVTAPTAGGKTEAVAAPVCERLVQNQWQALSAVIVTPTRALVNDLFLRLQQPVSDMGIVIGRKTSDHAISSELREQLLITTPESLESLLTFRKESLQNLRAVVMDEIHLLDGTPRGDQLRFILARLEAYLKHLRATPITGLQRIALSATVGDPKRLAGTYLGDIARIVEVPGQRRIDAKISLANGDNKSRAECAIACAEELGDVRKILVFVNSRKQVDEGADYFRCGAFEKVGVYGHHGSLSKHERERVEERFRSDSRAVCVATMTLEVGIDIGDVDLVVCLDPPFSLSSFLQRIGRGCRRLQGKTRVVCIARNRASELVFNALIHQSRLGVPRGPTIPARRSVMVQQVLAYLRQAPKRHRAAKQIERVLTSQMTPSVTNAMLLDVLLSMRNNGLLDVRDEIHAPAKEGWEFIESSKIYSNIAPSLESLALVDADTGKTVAKVRGLAKDSASVKIAGQAFSVLKGGNRTKRMVRVEGEANASPDYHARSVPYAFDIGASLSNYFAVPAGTLFALQAGDDSVVMTWLGRLLNTAIADSATKCGVEARAKSFAVVLSKVAPDEILRLFAKSISSMKDRNPLGNVSVEGFADLGPNFQRLSSNSQKAAREDWLDHEFLTAWISQVRELINLSPNDELYEDMAEVSRL